ncbi:nucleoside triphosphate pyrophosphohydrolase [Mycobacterium sp. 852002-51057_SCH5723018]|uniref:nucleoside triphosphate pyrophosphohydrolase n=1 Tax=Mycobacterium sp. 852002-51057_SCH5723018 TaxID=1834094 RepID=UPI0007FF2C33|nr:nucleoside triphosphate pyrophosphohydrolase [Mycobacterium sp. 852002-51057_SCH5723018]OBG22162.1 nucleoside triphosphate hydrolase [Mycobacterium sp. 852002-51057_SCH5723018]
MIVVLFDPRRPSLVPVEAIEHLTGEVQYTEEMPVAVPWSLPAARPVHSGDPNAPAPVLLSSDRDHPAVTARLAAGARLISAPDTPRGERLVDAVALMDKLRTAGPWESEQTHDSLRRFLLEETYELLDAVRRGNADQVREELGDVLLQVLFHARIAEDAPQFPFTIDDVAVTLMRKLGNRVPGVLAGQSISLEEQLAQWEERKAAEKPRNSVMDDVHIGQPALALAQKVIQRAEKAGLPSDLIPDEIRSVSISADIDAESVLRTAVLEFVDTVRGVERAVAATRRGGSVPEEFDVAPLGEVSDEEWRAHWPSGQPAIDSQPPVTEEPVGSPDDSAADADESGGDDESGGADDEPQAPAKAHEGGSKRRKGRK